MNLIARIVTDLVSPLGTALVLLLLAGVLSWRGRSARAARVAKGLSLAAFLWLWLWSTPLASDAIAGALEALAPPRPIVSLPNADAAVVLGGGVAGARPPQRPDPDLKLAADRVWHAARLYHAGKVRLVWLSGGAVEPGDANEAEGMQQFLLDLGVPRQAIRLEKSSVNTLTNAQFVAGQLRSEGVRSVLLVTSALHMRRALRNFERAGIAAQPAATDYEVVDRPFSLWRVLPEAGALERSARAMHELVGYWVGR